jgi:hypothetical protein
METGDSGLLIRAAQQLAEKVCRSDLASVTIRHLELVGNPAAEILKKFNFAMSRTHVLLKVKEIDLFDAKFRKSNNSNDLLY